MNWTSFVENNLRKNIRINRILRYYSKDSIIPYKTQTASLLAKNPQP